MEYKFVCPQCGKEHMIQMKMSEYKSEGHICECGAELKRDPNSFCKNFSVNCSGFYAGGKSG